MFLRISKESMVYLQMFFTLSYSKTQFFMLMRIPSKNTLLRSCPRSSHVRSKV